MISVAMALYNSIKFVEEQLDSIVNQSVSVDEVIIIDDCSTDGTIEYVNNYINNYDLLNWVVLTHEKNKGYIDTFFEAISKCQGDIILLCDHDDVWFPDKVKMIKEVFEREKDVLMLATSFEQIDKNGEIIPIKQKKGRSNNNLIRRRVKNGDVNKMQLQDVIVYNISPGCTCAISGKIKNEMLMNRCMLPHDWTLSILAACHGGLYYLDKPTTKYRIYDNNTIGLGHEGRYEKRRAIVENNYLEKEAMVKIIENNRGTKCEDYKYCLNIKRIFGIRKTALEKRTLIPLVFAMVLALGKGKLVESVLMDMITIIKG